MLRTLSLSYVVCQVGGWGLLMGFCWWQYPHLVDKMSVIVIDGLLDRLRQIEGMIDEDAAGARQAITEFSKLLRKGVLKVD